MTTPSLYVVLGALAHLADAGLALPDVARLLDQIDETTKECARVEWQAWREQRRGLTP